MKKRVRIYKAGGEQGTVINPLSKWMMQMGGPMQQQGASEDQIMNILEEAYLSMIEPVDLYETLIQNYQLPEPDALYYVDIYTQKLKEKRADKLNTPDAPDLVIPEEEYMDASEDFTEDTFEEEFRQGGQKSMSKKSFVNNVLKSVKKQTGGVINQSDKPEDAPKIKAETFINAVKAEKEKSELKTQAESMYDNIMQRGGFVDKDNPFYGNPELYKFIGGGPELSKAQDGQNVKQLEKAKQIAANMGYTGSDPVGFLEYMRAADMRSKQGRLPGDVPGTTWYPGQHQIHSPWHSQYMGRLGPIYPPLFGAGRWNTGIQYAGSWLKPGKVTSKTTTWKDMTEPRSSSTFIDSEGRVKANIPTRYQTTTEPEALTQPKRSKEEGVARVRGQMFWNYPKVSEYNSTPSENVQYNYPDSEDQNFRESKERRFRYPKISEYEPMNIERATKMTPMVPKGNFESDIPRDLQVPPTTFDIYPSTFDIYNRELADENRQARQEFELRNQALINSDINSFTNQVLNQESNPRITEETKELIKTPIQSFDDLKNMDPKTFGFNSPAENVEWGRNAPGKYTPKNVPKKYHGLWRMMQDIDALYDPYEEVYNKAKNSDYGYVDKDILNQIANELGLDMKNEHSFLGTRKYYDSYTPSEEGVQKKINEISEIYKIPIEQVKKFYDDYVDFQKQLINWANSSKENKKTLENFYRNLYTGKEKDHEYFPFQDSRNRDVELFLMMKGTPGQDPANIFDYDYKFQQKYGGQRNLKKGGLIKAQTGFNSCPPGYSKDMNPSSPSYGQCISSTGQVYRGSSTLSTPFELPNPFIQEDVVGIDPESGMYRNMDLPEQNMGMVEETTEYDPQNMWNIDFPQVLNQFNTGVRGALGFFGELGDRGKRIQQYANLTSDNVYLPNPWSKKNRGLYDPNSGLLQPGLMGSNNRSGYARRQFGGSIDDEVEMTEEELQEFLANGGEVEYL